MNLTTVVMIIIPVRRTATLCLFVSLSKTLRLCPTLVKKVSCLHMFERLNSSPTIMGRNKRSRLPLGVVVGENVCHKPKLHASTASTGIPTPPQPLHPQPEPPLATKPQGETIVLAEEPAKARNQVCIGILQRSVLCLLIWELGRLGDDGAVFETFRYTPSRDPVHGGRR